MRPFPALLGLLIMGSPAAAATTCPAGAKSAHHTVVCRDGVDFARCRRLAEEVGCSIVRELPSINAVVIAVPEGHDDGARARLQAKQEIECMETDHRVNWLRGGAPVKDVEWKLPPLDEIIKPFKPAPRAAVDPEQQWGVRRVRAEAAWARTQGRGVKVAVIDTGIDYRHPDLAPNVAGGVNVAERQKARDFTDDQGHGSHVSGIIGAARNGKGVVGVAPQVALYGVKVLDSEGNGSYSEIIAGIEWAIQNKMDVANMSLGASEGSQALRKAILAALKAGMVVVAAAGNDSGGPVSFPAAYPEVIAVSSSDKADRLSEFSSVGPEVDVIAPGSEILSTVPGGRYETLSGTSMAAPHVAGLAALAVASGSRGQSAVKAALQGAASRLPGLSGSQQGAGLVDAAGLVGGKARRPLLAAE